MVVLVVVGVAVVEVVVQLLHDDDGSNYRQYEAHGESNM